MSLRGYKKKGKAAIWKQAFPDQVKEVKSSPDYRIRSRTIHRDREERAYAKEAKAFVQAAIDRGETCPVVAKIESLRNGKKYGHQICNRLNEIHHQRGRVGGLLIDKRHWMAVSKQGHRFIHSNIAEARKHGWICESGLWNVPDKTN